MQEYRHKGKLIIGIDHGYGNMKTAHRVFKSGVDVMDEEPIVSKNYIKFDNKYYVIGESHLTYQGDKTQSEDYRILTIAAIAEELKFRNISDADVILAVGLPLAWVGKQKESFKKYLLEKPELKFEYKQEKYHVRIADVKVFSQGMAAVIGKDLKGFNMVADIGNGTMNIMQVNDERPIEKSLVTEKYGVNLCVKDICRELAKESGSDYPEEIVEPLIRYGTAHKTDVVAATVEKMATKYSTVDDDSYWTELAQVCHVEHDKYGAGGKVIEAREWIIALDESLLELDPDMVIRQFVDAFHNKYGVECKAALHHNSKQTNYHIHMIFSERQLLEQPIEKVATRNMFFDENGKHKRTKKEILDAEGNVREECKIIAKGEVYERQKFTGKNPIFKTVAFKKEAQELFKNINNSLITDEDRKLSIFNPESVYLATKKIGKNNPMAEYIIADNEERKEWNRSVDQALIALVDRNDILAVKHNSIQDKVKTSIAENGNAPGMFAGIVKKAVAIIKDMVQKAYEKMEVVTQSVETVVPDTNPSVNKEVKPIRIPPKPQPPSGIDNLEHLQAVFNKIKRYGGKIRANEKTIEALEKAAGTYTSIFQALDKIQLERDIKKLKAENEGAHLMQENIIRQYGYTTVDAFMMLYWNTKNAKDTYEKKLSDWTAKYGNLSDGEVAKEIGISHRISDAKNRVKQQTISEPAKQKKRSERTDR